MANLTIFDEKRQNKCKKSKIRQIIRTKIFSQSLFEILKSQPGTRGPKSKPDGNWPGDPHRSRAISAIRSSLGSWGFLLRTSAQKFEKPVA